jgi:hypothetical protein
MNTDLLDEIVDPIARKLNPDAASALLGIRASKAAARRMAFLARKCNEGELTPEERTEYETNVIASEFLALLQARARALLARKKKS